MSTSVPGSGRSEVQLTVLKKGGGRWSQAEVDALRAISPLMHADDVFPEYLILWGCISEEQVAEYLLIPEEVSSITHVVGMTNPDLPFEIKGVR